MDNLEVFFFLTMLYESNGLFSLKYQVLFLKIIEAATDRNSNKEKTSRMLIRIVLGRLSQTEVWLTL